MYRIAGRLLIKHSSNPRPSSSPYISGDGFRNIANHIYDNAHKNIIPENIIEKDMVFVGDSNIKKFFLEIHPRIINKYILVTHNGDENIDEKSINFIDEKIIKWYGINVSIEHPKIVPLPLGIENKHYYVLGIPAIFNIIRKRKETLKKNKIFYAFSVKNNIVERQPALEALQKTNTAETTKLWMNFYSYLNFLINYKFTASPIGSSIEGHRNWDAVYTKVVPVVKETVTTKYFEKIGLPFWNIKNWNELQQYDEDYLAKKYSEIINNSNNKTMWMDYWIDKIKNAKD